MIHNDHMHLIKKAIPGDVKGIWADFGSGWGAFTLALRDLAGKDIQIYSVDKNRDSLEEQKVYFRTRFANTKVNFLLQDFTKELELPPLDGILMANSLHYIEDKVDFLKSIKKYLKPNGKILVVEYETDTPNSWIPFPVSFGKFSELVNEAQYKEVKHLENIKLDYLSMYSAEAS